MILEIKELHSLVCTISAFTTLIFVAKYVKEVYIIKTDLRVKIDLQRASFLHQQELLKLKINEKQDVSNK